MTKLQASYLVDVACWFVAVGLLLTWRNDPIPSLPVPWATLWLFAATGDLWLLDRVWTWRKGQRTTHPWGDQRLRALELRRWHRRAP